jgi:hypothetical protein
MAATALWAGSIGSIQAQTTFHLNASSCGTWNAAGVHVAGGGYQIGYSKELPTKQAAYFVFNLDPVKGRTVTAANVTVPGTTDFDITGTWPNHPTPPHNFKVGITPQNTAANTVAQITNGNNDASIYNNAVAEQDLGYGWVPDGLHKGVSFDAFHYNNVRLQTMVNNGGQVVMWAIDRADINAGAENYIWGSSSCSNVSVFNITVK